MRRYGPVRALPGRAGPGRALRFYYAVLGRARPGRAASGGGEAAPPHCVRHLAATPEGGAARGAPWGRTAGRAHSPLGMRRSPRGGAGGHLESGGRDAAGGHWGLPHGSLTAPPGLWGKLAEKWGFGGLKKAQWLPSGGFCTKGSGLVRAVVCACGGGVPPGSPRAVCPL